VDNVAIAGGGQRSPVVKDHLIAIRYTEIGWTNCDCDTWTEEDWEWSLEHRDASHFGTEEPQSQPGTDWIHQYYGNTSELCEVVQVIGAGAVRFVASWTDQFALMDSVQAPGNAVYVWNGPYLVGTLSIGSTDVTDLVGPVCGGTLRVGVTITVE